MASIFDIRDKAKRAAGKPISGVQLEVQASNPAAQEAPAAAVAPASPAPARRTLPPFTSTDGRNYRAIYRVVCEYHERHNQPDTPGFWHAAMTDKYEILSRYNDDPFIRALLDAVNDEIEREQTGGNAAKAESGF